MFDGLAARTVREVLPKRVDLFDLPVVAADATSIEIAAVMAAQRSPIVAVMDGSRFVGGGVGRGWVDPRPFAGQFGHAFGLAHQMRGPGRWPWVAFSAIVGLALGALYAATGSLLGPIAAHAAINAANLAWLRSGAWQSAATSAPPKSPAQGLSPT